MRLLVAATALLLFNVMSSMANDWPRFRGPGGAGVVEGPAVAERWSEDQNLKWRTPLPGKGASSPVVAGDRVYVTCYTGYGEDMQQPGDPNDLVRHLIAFDRNTGEELWRASVPSEGKQDPYTGFIAQHGYASSSPAADVENVYVLFGKSGLFAFDKYGEQIWHVDLGEKSDPAKWGDASSPIVVGDTVVIDAGILGNHFVGVNKHTSDVEWTISDPSYTNCWATPTEYETRGDVRVLVHVPKKVMAIDPMKGEVVWTAASPLEDATCGSIVTNNGVAYFMGSRAGHAMAVRCGGTGDVTSSNTVWRKQIRSGIATPVVVGKNMYWLTGGVFYAASLSTGEYVYKERLPRINGPTGGFPNADYSSPIAVGGLIIQFTRNGESYVIEAGDEFKLVAHNPAFEGDDSSFSATPAVSDGQLFMRSDSFLYCIAKD